MRQVTGGSRGGRLLYGYIYIRRTFRQNVSLNFNVCLLHDTEI